MISKTCAICLDITKNWEKINKQEENWLQTLQRFAPEIEWSETYDICFVCIREIEQFEKFHRICIENEAKRQKLFTEHIVIEIVPSEDEEPAEAESQPEPTECEPTNLNEIEVIREDLTPSPPVVLKYPCPSCENVYLNHFDFRQHKLTHVKSRKCENANTNSSDFQQHEQPPVESHECDECDRTFKRLSNLNAHRTAAHVLEPKRFPCDQCPRVFPNRWTLKAHTRKHTGERPYVCQVCASAFVSSSGLSRHLGTHTEIKPFECDVCDRAFRGKESRRQHMAIVHEIGEPKIIAEKNFACNICPKLFYYRQGLNRHLARHENDGNKSRKTRKWETPPVSRRVPRGGSDPEPPREIQKMSNVKPSREIQKMDFIYTVINS